GLGNQLAVGVEVLAPEGVLYPPPFLAMGVAVEDEQGAGPEERLEDVGVALARLELVGPECEESMDVIRFADHDERGTGVEAQGGSRPVAGPGLVGRVERTKDTRNAA